MPYKTLTVTFIILICTIFTFKAFSQEVIYFTKDSSANRKISKKGSTEKSIIKIAPLSFLSGTIPVYFERELTDFLSIQIGAGVTTRNYLREWANNLEFDKKDGDKVELTWNGGNNITNINPLTDFTNRKSGIAFTFSAEPRIYFQSEGISGTFIGFGFNYSKFKTSSRKIQSGSTDYSEPVFTNNYFAENEKISDISVNFGSQTLNDRISLEYLIGIALRNKSGSTYIYGYDNMGTLVDGSGTYKKTIPAFLFSFKVGYHW